MTSTHRASTIYPATSPESPSPPLMHVAYVNYYLWKSMTLDSESLYDAPKSREEFATLLMYPHKKISYRDAQRDSVDYLGTEAEFEAFIYEWHKEEFTVDVFVDKKAVLWDWMSHDDKGLSTFMETLNGDSRTTFAAVLRDCFVQDCCTNQFLEWLVEETNQTRMELRYVLKWYWRHKRGI